MVQEPQGWVSRFLFKKNTSITFVTVFLACVLVLAACGGTNTTNTPSNQPKKGGNIVVGLIAEPTILDPLTSASLYDSDITANTYDTLLKYDNVKHVVGPELATPSYDSPTVLNLMLRTDVTFHDGTPFNADAVIFNLNRFINDKASPRYTDVSDIDSLVKVSDSQVQIKLKKPFAPFLTVLTGAIGMMLSPTAVKKLTPTQLGNAPINAGSGPFMFVEWIKGDHLLLKANPHYWKKDDQGNSLPYLQSIRYRTITNGQVMYNNLETAQVQVATGIDPNDIALAKANPNLTYKQIPGPGFASMQLNESVAPFTNVHVRRAIAWGINRAEIVHNVLKDAAIVAKGPISPAVWAYDQKFAGYTYDLNKAKAEMAQSGVTSVTFTLLITGGNPALLQEAQFIQSELQPIGITVNLKQETFTTLITDFQTFHYQALLVGWTGSLDPDGVLYLMFKSNGGFNYTKYADPRVDTLLESGRTTTDQAQRIPIYQQAQQLIVEDASRIFIDHGAVAQETTSNVKNYNLLPSGVLDFTSVYLA